MTDPRNTLFQHFVRLLRGLKPRAFVMENVTGLAKGKMKYVFVRIMNELKASGYKVKCKIMNAKYYDVPQARQRLIFLGIINEMNLVARYPEHTSRPFGIDYPETRTAKDLIPQDRVIEYKRRKKHNLSFNYCPVLTDEKPSPTIRKVMRLSYIHRYIVNGRHYRPSSIELSCLGSFPLEFKFVGSYNLKWQQIGNSVPPLMMRAIATSLKQQLRNFTLQTT